MSKRPIVLLSGSALESEIRTRAAEEVGISEGIDGGYSERLLIQGACRGNVHCEGTSYASIREHKTYLSAYYKAIMGFEVLSFVKESFELVKNLDRRRTMAGTF